MDRCDTSLRFVKIFGPGCRREYWQIRGRLIARELDATHVVVRVPFDVRDWLLQMHPQVFSVPAQFAKHMMVVADLAASGDDAVEEAVRSAWRLQSDGDDALDGGKGCG